MVNVDAVLYFEVSLSHVWALEFKLQRSKQNIHLILKRHLDLLYDDLDVALICHSLIFDSVRYL